MRCKYCVYIYIYYVIHFVHLRSFTSYINSKLYTVHIVSIRATYIFQVLFASPSLHADLMPYSLPKDSAAAAAAGPRKTCRPRKCQGLLPTSQRQV